MPTSNFQVRVWRCDACAAAAAASTSGGGGGAAAGSAGLFEEGVQVHQIHQGIQGEFEEGHEGRQQEGSPEEGRDPEWSSASEARIQMDLLRL